MPLGSGSGNGDCRLHDKHGPQPLAAGKDGVAHGAMNRRGHRFDAGKQLFEGAIGQLRALF